VTLNETHDSRLRSFVPGANREDRQFPIQNLPLAIARRKGRAEKYRGVVAIGNHALDLEAARVSGLFDGLASTALAAASQQKLNSFMALGTQYWSSLRLALSRALREGAAGSERLASCLIPQKELEFDVPALIGDFTDFYASVHHATRVGRMFRPDTPLMPNYKWVPVAYHCRSSSIRTSGHDFPRPVGQRKDATADRPIVGPCVRVDYELELGLFVGPGNSLGDPIAMRTAEDHVFGLCVLNDWSARDIQSWEYQPLGPFLGKSFATTISPWIVPLEALEPYRLPFSRIAGDPQPLAHLDSADNRTRGAINIELMVSLQSEQMRSARISPMKLASCNYMDSYWTIQQMIAHHTSNGCNLQPGDLIGTGTLSGPQPADLGSMIELTKGGKDPITLPSGERREFVGDGDTIFMTASCRREGFATIGFGECFSTVLPPRAWSLE
jgi:fumarylacetoacetase